MSSHAAIPEGVDEKSAALLRRAYAVATTEDGQQLYQDWAATYDATMVQGLGYLTPRLVAEALARYLKTQDAPVLDIGCGTGLVGAAAANLGFRHVDGLDLSRAMMSVAVQGGAYRRLLEADLTKALPVASGEYAAVVCAGTFTSGHVDAACLDELVRVLRPGGWLVCTVHHAVWEPLGFAAGFAKLAAADVLLPTLEADIGYYTNSTNDGRLLVFRTAAA
jgi:predicted TPR repeat methyltransferase